MQASIEVTDRDGWRKEFPLLRNLVMVGSDPANDISLPEARGQGAEPRHLQILLNPQDTGACRIINMAKNPVEIVIAGEVTWLAPSTAMMVSMESALRIGEYQLQLHGFATTPRNYGTNSNGVGETAAFQGVTPTPWSPVNENRIDPSFTHAPSPTYGKGSIGLAVRMSRPTLTPTEPAEATISIANRGTKTAVQFRLMIEGLPAECYEVPPLPLLFPNAEKTLTIQLRHPDKSLQAGSHPVRFVALAPDAYPDEQTVVQHTVVVPTIYAHEVTLRGPL